MTFTILYSIMLHAFKLYFILSFIYFIRPKFWELGHLPLSARGPSVISVVSINNSTQLKPLPPCVPWIKLCSVSNFKHIFIVLAFQLQALLWINKQIST